MTTSSWRAALSRREWAHVAVMAGVVVALHLAGWLVLMALVVPQHLSVGGRALGVGVGLTAYMIGLRHAFDADHIAAIDNTTRKLMSDGQRPLTTGFFFSLGHSTVVFVVALLLSVGVRTLSGPVMNDASPLHRYAAIFGTTVSGVFLYLIAGINIAVLMGIVRIFRRMRRGVYDEGELERQLNNRGLAARFLQRFTRSIRSPWQLYPLGVLFGLGFDTATEVALLVLAGSSAAAGVPWYAILCLPVLFAAGMSLLDTIDGSFMNFAYGWAFSQPARKVYYNITITALSAAVALAVGSIELAGVLADQLGLTGDFWEWLRGIDLNAVGFIIVGVFALTWAVALLIWRFARIEQRWSRLAED